MRHGWLIVMTVIGMSKAAEPEAFRPPHAYDAQRYEVGWNRNPFTLQTTPGAVTADSFALDLAVATYFGDAADPTVVIVNTKTHERTSIQKSKPAANGWRLGTVNLGEARQKITVELLKGRERALLRFDLPYVCALAATAAPSAGNSEAQKSRQLLTIPLPGTGAATRPPTARQTPPAATTAPAESALLPPPPAAVAAGSARARLIPLPTLPSAARQDRIPPPPSS
jgi:hypothetical protein